MTFAKRNDHGKRRARSVLVVLCRDASVVEQYERVGEVETDTGAEMPVVGMCLALVEPLEDTVYLVLWYSLASVVNLNHHILVIMAHCDIHLSPGGGVFERIRQEVDQHLVEVGKVNPYRQVLVFVNELELYLLCFGLIFKHIAYVVDESDDVGLAHSHLHHALFDFPQVHHLVDEVQNTVCISLYGYVCSCSLRVAFILEQRHQRSHDKRHRGAYLMAYVYEEFYLRLVHFLGVDMILQFQSVLLLAFAVSDI